MEPIGEFVFRLEVGDERFEYGGIQQAVAGGKRNVFIHDGWAAGGRFPIDTIMSRNAHKEIDDHEMLAWNVDAAWREALPQHFHDGFREIVDMRQSPFLVQIPVEYE